MKLPILILVLAASGCTTMSQSDYDKMDAKVAQIDARMYGLEKSQRELQAEWTAHIAHETEMTKKRAARAQETKNKLNALQDQVDTLLLFSTKPR